MESFSPRDLRITRPNGEVVSEFKGIRIPPAWSDQAATIFADKYLHKGGLSETGVDDVVGRMIDHWALFHPEDDRQAYKAEMREILIGQYGAPNSPQWFNAGLALRGVKGTPSGFHYRLSPEGPVLVDDAYTYPQVHACFILNVEDDLCGKDGIMEIAQREAGIFKYGSGAGMNLSKLRGAGEPLRGGGKSSGLMSWVNIYNAIGGAIKSGGTTRRAAQMLVIDDDHPDVLEFIRFKAEEERKAQALIQAGFDGSFEGPAYSTVGGQNANNSIRLTDIFIEAVQGDRDWNLLGRLGGVTKTLKARALVDALAEAAWACADPGVQYHDNVNLWDTCPGAGVIRASNPCSEFCWKDNTACNLASIRLTQYLGPTGFDVIRFVRDVGRWVETLDHSIDLASYPSAEIAEKSGRFRTIGLGYSDLGSLLMLQGLAYDSFEGRLMAAAITSLMTAAAYHHSGCLAEKLGAFPGYEPEAMKRVLELHVAYHKVLTTLDSSRDCGMIIRAASELWALVLEHAKFRNAQVTLLAPTGTIGLVMDCQTFGIEPEYSLIKYKTLAGGGSLRMVNQYVGPALERLGYEAKTILDHLDRTGSVVGSGVRDEHLGVFDTAGAAGGRSISWLGHLLMMAAVQPFLSGAISKTVNLPRQASKADVASIYMLGWSLGLKGLALYRDGCKGCQPLNGVAEAKEVSILGGAFSCPYAEGLSRMTPEKFGGVLQEPVRDLKPQAEPVGVKAPTPATVPERAIEGPKPELPRIRTSRTYELDVDGQRLYLHIGEHPNGHPVEIFIDMFRTGSPFRGLLDVFCIAVSIGLRSGVPVEKLINKFVNADFEPRGRVIGHPRIKRCTSVIDLVFKIIGLDYYQTEAFANVHAEDVEAAPKPKLVTPQVLPIPGEKINVIGEGPLCKHCGHATIRRGTCFTCDACGQTSGCS